VVSATSNRLVVSQPFGATYAPITVVNRGRTGYSPKQFLPTFPGGSARIDSNSFSGPVEARTKDAPMRVVVADFDGDGKAEIAAAVSYDHLIAIYRNKSPRGILEKDALTPILEIPFNYSPDENNPVSMIASDLDGDGRIDLVVSDRINDRIGVLRNTSSAGVLSFAPPVFVPVGGDPRDFTIRDMNQDGLPDLIVPNYGRATISILQNTSVPGSSRISFGHRLDLPVRRQPMDVAAGDLDGDGRPDLAVANAGEVKIIIYQNVHTQGILTTNSFAPRIEFEAPFAGHSIVIADIDRDGKEDVIMGTRQTNIVVFHNRTSPGVLSTNSFAPAQIFASDGNVQQVALGDLNGDGRPEIVAATEQESHVSIFENRSTPGKFTAESLAPRLDLKTGWNCTSLVVADMDADGKSDLVFCCGYGNVVCIYKNLLR
jgi:hypothetical protein